MFVKRTGKVLIVGVLDVAGSTNIEMAEGFKSLGYEVEAYNYRTVEGKIGITPMWLDFMASLSGKKYDLIVFCKTNSMHPRLLHEAKEYGPTWYWFMDNFEACRQVNAAGYAANASLASATASDVAERFSMVNNNAHHIFEGYNPKLYYKEDLRKIRDFIFIGNATIPRVIALTDLRKAGLDISIFGYGWPIGMDANGPVTGEDERIEINNSKVVLNLCHDNVIFSDRVTKAFACGANVISQNCSDLREMIKWFTNNPLHIKDIEQTNASWITVVNDKGNLPEFNERSQFVLNPQVDVAQHIKRCHSWEATASKLIERMVVGESTIR